MNQRTIDQRHAFAQATSSAFVPNVGYVAVGAPRMPANPIFGPERCLPTPGTLNGSIHELWSPDKVKAFRMTWQTRTWQPVMLGSANRLGFTAAYLAAYGWSYKGPV